jgi:hypothetical protein
VPAGERTVTASAAGYGTQSQSVNVIAGETVTAHFVLEEKALPTEVIAQCITYTTSGGRNQDRHLLITVQVVDDFGNLVAGAEVSIDVLLGGESYSTGTGALTDANGEVTYTLNNAPNGLYTTVVTGIVAEGLTYEGSFPMENEFAKGTDAVPAQSCIENLTLGAADRLQAALDSARQAKARHSDALFNIPNVVGHGVSAVRGRPIIEIYLSQEDAAARRQIPAALERTPVRVVITGPFVAY